MFESFTDRSRKVMTMANQQALRLNHEYIGTEHILLGLVEEGSGVAAGILREFDITPGNVHLELERLLKCGPDEVAPGPLPQTPRAKKVIEYAIEESRTLNHRYVGTEHLLLGLLREQDGVAASVLEKLGLTRERALSALNARSTTDAQPQTRETGRFESTDRARKVMALAIVESQRANDEYTGSEHILLGLLKEGCSGAANILNSLDVDLRKVNQELDKLDKSKRRAATKSQPVASTRQVTEYAIEEALALHCTYIGTEHLLLGLLRAKDDTAARLLVDLGLSLPDIRERVLDLLKTKRDRRV